MNATHIEIDVAELHAEHDRDRKTLTDAANTLDKFVSFDYYGEEISRRASDLRDMIRELRGDVLAKQWQIEAGVEHADEDDEPPYDTPSLEDAGIELGSYAS